MTENVLNKISDQFFKENFNTFINENLEESYYYIIKDNSCNLNNKVCESLQELYNIKNMIIVEYDKCAMSASNCEIEDKLKEKTLQTYSNKLLEEYIDYVTNYYDIDENKEYYSYIILTEIEENGNTYYSNIRIR